MSNSVCGMFWAVKASRPSPPGLTTVKKQAEVPYLEVTTPALPEIPYPMVRVPPEVPYYLVTKEVEKARNLPKAAAVAAVNLTRQAFTLS